MKGTHGSTPPSFHHTATSSLTGSVRGRIDAFAGTPRHSHTHTPTLSHNERRHRQGESPLLRCVEKVSGSQHRSTGSIIRYSPRRFSVNVRARFFSSSGPGEVTRARVRCQPWLRAVRSGARWPLAASRAGMHSSVVSAASRRPALGSLLGTTCRKSDAGTPSRDASALSRLPVGLVPPGVAAVDGPSTCVGESLPSGVPARGAGRGRCPGSSDEVPSPDASPDPVSSPEAFGAERSDSEAVARGSSCKSGSSSGDPKNPSGRETSLMVRRCVDAIGVEGRRFHRSSRTPSSVSPTSSMAFITRDECRGVRARLWHSVGSPLGRRCRFVARAR